MTPMEKITIEQAAHREIREEEFRAKVDLAKNLIRERMGRPWWRRLFPFRIKIERM